MRRHWQLWTIAGVGAIALAVVWLTSTSGAQNAGNGGQAKAGDSPLPIKQVVLFNSGVGYFQREGDVSGDARVDLTFPVGDVNDLLKSLVLQDLGGGRISSVNYDSHDPIDKILRSFALDLNNNPSFGQILNQARGEKIEITRTEKPGAQPTKLTGTIVGMETQKRPAGKDLLYDVEMLNLTGPSGLQAIPLETVLGVKFLNPTLDSEFQRALKVLAHSHDAQKKLVSLGFNGAGKRAVRVGYVVERPIWKTTYRLRLEPNGKLSLQGWALVENTSDDDWNEVRMVLVSGKPISYQMNLYEPLYIPRPFVEPEMFASLRPPVYSGTLDPGAVMGGPVADKAPIQERQKAQQNVNQQPMAPNGLPMNQAFNPYMFNPYLQPGMQGGFGGFNNGVMNPNFGQLGGGQFGQLGGNYNLGNFSNNKYQNSNNDALMQQQLDLNQKNNRLTYEELQQRRQRQEQQKGDAKKAGASIAGLNFKEGIQSVATAEEIGDYFQYMLDQKISLPRQKSAMLPILDHTIEGSKVSIYNEATHAKYPLLGLKFKNTAGLPLTQGPITVYEGQTYAGDTRILDVQPNEERLLSYALDQSTEVKSEAKSVPSPDMNFKIGETQLTARYKLRQTRTYTIKNRSAHDRTIILEHPIRSDWKLIDPVKPSEKTRADYRFTVQVAAGKTVTYDVVEDQARLDNFALQGGNPPFYATGLGIDVKQLRNTNEQKLQALRIVKGIVLPTWKTKESKTYLVQNLSDQDRNFTVDHVIRPDWVRIAEQGDNQRGPGVFRFELKVAKGKTGTQEVHEEKTHTDKGKLLKEFPEIRLKEFANNAATSAESKAGLLKALALAAKIAETKGKLAEEQKQLGDLTKDQERLRANITIIPQSSEHYKKFLEKFVSQESRIEGIQSRIIELQATLVTQEREYEAFVAALTTE